MGSTSMRRAEQSVALLAEVFLAKVFARLDQIQIALNLDRHNYGFVIQRPEISHPTPPTLNGASVPPRLSSPP